MNLDVHDYRISTIVFKRMNFASIRVLFSKLVWTIKSWCFNRQNISGVEVSPTDFTRVPFKPLWNLSKTLRIFESELHKWFGLKTVAIEVDIHCLVGCRFNQKLVETFTFLFLKKYWLITNNEKDFGREFIQACIAPCHLYHGSATLS